MSWERAQKAVQNQQGRIRTKPIVDPALAHAAFEKICSQCHATSEVDRSPPRSAEEVRTLTRMACKPAHKRCPYIFRKRKDPCSVFHGKELTLFLPKREA